MLPLSFLEKFMTKPVKDAIAAEESIQFRLDDHKKRCELRSRLYDILSCIEECKKLAAFIGPKERP